MTHRSFSGRQLALLEMLDHIGLDGHITIEEAQGINQTTFRSALIRGYCIYRSSGPSRGFHVTKEGREALRDFHQADIARKNPMLPLTAYFDPVAYGLAPNKKGDNVREFIKRKAAS